MPRISCSVTSCSYNASGICDASALKIVGNNANITEQTSCSTYDGNGRCNNSTCVSRGETETIGCDVQTCVYNKHEYCSLSDGIEVGNLGTVTSYTDTDCLSFERK
ncbi:DUF1540 domain-containing protein [Cellulosilyticum ruminicola]|uniref:DUF1540 domain-containing protein n=1 Tax=Cellulosilyticum ruminicola TaxID=425254 RepID=UPI0006D2050A|nr:DUF1540 domain-containing protein [Cellulosilyticum ruminicola]